MTIGSVPFSKSLVILGCAAVLSACTSIGYRCPLDPNEKAEHPTACTNMQEAMSGAKRGTGGKTSVLLDDKGRVIPPELLQANPGKFQGHMASAPYRDKSGNPIFNQSKVYQVWTEAYQDNQGNMYDGQHAWFATPGRWAYGSMDQPTAVGNQVMSPSRPDQLLLPGRIVPENQIGTVTRPSSTPSPVTQATPQDRDRAALQNLSNAAANLNSAPQRQPTGGGVGSPFQVNQNAPVTVNNGVPNAGVTAPGLILGQ